MPALVPNRHDIPSRLHPAHGSRRRSAASSSICKGYLSSQTNAPRFLREGRPADGKACDQPDRQPQWPVICLLRLPALDSPASMSILDESTIAVLGPMMGVPSDHLLFPRRNLLEPYVKGLTLMVNSIFSGNCREDIWLDK